MNIDSLIRLCQVVRYNILTSTTEAGSGHPTSSLSAVELMTALFFGGYLKYDLNNPKYIFNDRIIFSKGHAAPLLYSLYQAAGVITHQELLTLRQFNSRLEGHPTPQFKYVDVATGSLGQGLSIGVGIALGMKLVMSSEFWVQSKKNNKTTLKTHDSRLTTHNPEPRTFVLLGDSEMAEGQVWEAMGIASHYKLNNLVAIVDVNRLGQRGETMLGWDLKKYKSRAEAFGWDTIIVEDGHSIQEVEHAYGNALSPRANPVMVIAKTIKGKGVSFIEDKDGWHGKAIPKNKLDEALKEIGPIDMNIKGVIKKPSIVHSSGFIVHSKKTTNYELSTTNYKLGSLVATREAYGNALVDLGIKNPSLVVLDAETSNSTYADKFKDKFPERYFEMYIAEQNMASVAIGFAKLGFTPYISSFAAFLSRSFDQLRMGQYSEANVKVCGSHAGISIGYDGSSQMALEDISMFRSILESTVFYPSDATSAYRIVEQSMDIPGIVYIRTTREKTPVLYKSTDSFKVGGSKIVKQSKNDVAVIFTAGITVHEAIKAYEELKKDKINIAVVDLYSIKPIDSSVINNLTSKIHNVIVVEDHYPYGGIGEAVLSALSSMRNSLVRTGRDLSLQTMNYIHLAVSKIPHSASPEELLAYEKIDAKAIINEVKNILKSSAKTLSQ